MVPRYVMKLRRDIRRLYKEIIKVEVETRGKPLKLYGRVP